MTDPKNPEAINEELDLEELKDAAGGVEGGSGNDRVQPRHKRTALYFSARSGPEAVSATAGPGGTTFPKTNLGGSAGPGGDDI